MTDVAIHTGDALEVLCTLPSESVHCCVTSPPYFGLRDYGVPGQIGLEKTPREFVERLARVFEEVRRVLRSDGTCWVNIGDCYSESGRGGNPSQSPHVKQRTNFGSLSVRRSRSTAGLGKKQLLGVPWRLAFRLQDDGWILRSDVIWEKANPMPESVTDRPTKGHEYLFLLTKSLRYFYDLEAVKEPATDTGRVNGRDGRREDARARPPGSGPRTLKRVDYTELGRNLRTVWKFPTSSYGGEHFATMPPEMAERCILAGCPEGGTVLDPFAGAGTTGLVTHRLGRAFVGIELNPTYADMARRRIEADAPLLTRASA